MASTPAEIETPELSDLDHAVYEYLCLRGFNSIAQAFMSSIFHAGGSVPVPMSSLFRFWNDPIQDQTPAAAAAASSVAPAAPTQPSPQPESAIATVVTAGNQLATEKMHLCSWPNCTRSFRKKSNLQRHMMLHQGRRPFRCTLERMDGSACTKSFARESDLAAHIRVHNGIRPFVCPDCGKKFTRNSDWRAHVKSVHGKAPYACIGPGCTARFETQKEQRAHYLVCKAAKPPPAETNDNGGDAALSVISVNGPCRVSTCSHTPPPSTSPKRFACSGHDRPSFQVRHEDHFDFLIDGELHHWTDKYCESHGLFSLIDYVPTSAANSSS